MRILIISDTHARHGNLEIILKRGSYDKVFHLGDSEGSEGRIARLVGVPLEIVRGNCDMFSKQKEDIILSLKGNTVLLTHGHRYGVKRDYFDLVRRARDIGAKYVFFGHTHRAEICEVDGIILANPGSLTHSATPSYIVADVEDNGQIHLSLNYV